MPGITATERQIMTIHDMQTWAAPIAEAIARAETDGSIEASAAISGGGTITVVRGEDCAPLWRVFWTAEGTHDVPIGIITDSGNTAYTYNSHFGGNFVASNGSGIVLAYWEDDYELADFADEPVSA